MSSHLFFRVFVLFITVCLASCSSESDLERPIRGQLSSIEYCSDDHNFTENFYYNLSNELFKIEKIDSTNFRYEFKYNEGRLVECLTYNASIDSLLAKDSISYNNDGTINSKYIFYFENYEPSLVAIDRYSYDEQKRVFLFKNEIIGGSATMSYSYFWEGGNIKTLRVLLDGELIAMYAIEYDNKNNFRKRIPRAYLVPFEWTANNPIKSQRIDIENANNLNCDPCVFDYEYLEDFPISAKADYGYSLKMRYK